MRRCRRSCRGWPAQGKCAPNRNGGRHCCQPPLRRAKDMPVFGLLWPRPGNRFVTPLLDPGSPAQASHSTEPLPLSRSPIDLLDCAARGFAGLSTFPARRLEPKSLEAKTIQCSAALLGMPSTASRFAHRPHPHEENPTVPGTASRDRKTALPAPLPGWSERTRKLFPFLPAEIGPLVTCRTFLPLPTLWRGRDRRPDHPCTMHPSPELRKRKMRD